LLAEVDSQFGFDENLRRDKLRHLGMTKKEKSEILNHVSVFVKAIRLRMATPRQAQDRQDDGSVVSRQAPRRLIMHAWRAGFPIKAFGNDRLKRINPP